MDDRPKRLKHYIDILDRIHYTSHSLGADYNTDKALNHILEISSRGLGIKHAVVYRYNSDTRILECIKAYGSPSPSEDFLKSKKVRTGRDDCTLVRVFVSGQQEIDNGIHALGLERDESAIKPSWHLDNCAYLFTPIQAADRHIGVLGVSYESSDQTTCDEEMEFITLVANEVGIALDKALLIENTLKRRERQREFIENIFLNMMSGLIIIDPSRIVFSINNYAAQVLDLSADDAIGRTIDMVFSSHDQLIAIIDQTIQAQQTMSCDLELIMAANKSRFIDLTLSYIAASAPANRDSILLTFRDITERTELEKVVRRSDRLVALGTLAAGIAHEIRNPLTGLSLLFDDVHDKVVDQPEIREVINKTALEIDKFENLVSSLLDFSASREATHQACRIGEIVEQLLFMVQKQFTKTGARIYYQEDELLPSVWADAEKIKQALLNIILNSLNVLGKDGQTHIRACFRQDLEGMPEGRGLEITISDNGPGIDPHDLEFIFDPFYTTNPNGTGLGLAIVHTIIQEHGGRISVLSKKGQGATFTILLPIMENQHGKNSDHR